LALYKSCNNNNVHALNWQNKMPAGAAYITICSQFH